MPRGRTLAALAVATVGALAACAPDSGHPMVAGTGGTNGGGSGGISGGSGGASGDVGPPVLSALSISGQEVVTRLAKVLWNGTPDADLTRRADAGTIKTRGCIQKWANNIVAGGPGY